MIKINIAIFHHLVFLATRRNLQTFETIQKSKSKHAPSTNRHQAEWEKERVTMRLPKN